MLKQIASNYIVGTVMSHFSYATVTQVPIVWDNRSWSGWTHVVPVAPTPHQSYGLQVFGIVLIRILVFGDKPSKLRIVLKDETAELNWYGREPHVVAITGIPHVPQVTLAKKPSKVDADENNAGPTSCAMC
jgi:hypothetical protein